MNNCTESATNPDTVWESIKDDANAAITADPILAGLLQPTILAHCSLGEALSYHLAERLQSASASSMMLRDSFAPIFEQEDIAALVANDIAAAFERDSACMDYLTPFLYYKGFLALQCYRAAHQLWNQGRHSLALLLQHLCSVHFAVDIHPAARIGSGVMIDHATGVVIGETAVVENCVSIMQSVTLGGTGKVAGDRHPKIRSGVLIGPGAKILGNIEVGEGAMVAAASVVLKPVPEHAIVAGVPAKIVGHALHDEPSKAMDHYFQCD